MCTPVFLLLTGYEDSNPVAHVPGLLTNSSKLAPLRFYRVQAKARLFRLKGDLACKMGLGGYTQGLKSG